MKTKSNVPLSLYLYLAIKIIPRNPFHFYIYLITSAFSKLGQLSCGRVNIPLSIVNFPFAMLRHRRITLIVKFIKI